MPQQTNLNVAPYFDDFDPTNDFQRVLFKPGYPVQARELTTLQSILQNQVEKFGQHFFREGAKVIPGNIGYSQLYYAVQLTNTFQGVPVEAYTDQLIGTTITGQTSGVTATVDNVLSSADSERGNVTLYVSYDKSSTRDNATQTFTDGEALICNQIITSGLLGNSVIDAGVPFATTISVGASATGSVFQIENGVYFIRGYFVNVNKESLILDQYTNTPNYRIGLFVSEEIVNSNLDESLNDNSQGFNNYGAPGADRFKISVSLLKKSLDDFNDDNFVLLATVKNGVIEAPTRKGGALRGNGGVFFDDLTDVLARRTYDESGHYIVKPFNVSIVNSLNNNLGNQGIFELGQFTPSGGVPSSDLALCRISPGKAYVKGYEVETIAPTFIDVPKPRTTRTIEDQFFKYNTGPTLRLNSVYRSPTIGLGNTSILSLRNQRVGLNSETDPGKEIGLARIFDFRLESGSYNSSLPNINQWGISLYDVETFTDITVNQAITLMVPSFVEGNSSGATGFVRSPVSAGTAVTVYEKRGDFIKDEVLIFRSGISSNTTKSSTPTIINRVATNIVSHGISDIKSVYSNTGIGASTDGSNVVGINTFSANVVQTPSLVVGVASITKHSGGVSTVRSANPLFPGSIKVNDLIQYSDLGKSEDPISGRVVSIASSLVVISGVATVTGVISGAIPTTGDFNASDLIVMKTSLDSSSDPTLYSVLPKDNIATVNLTDATLTIRKTFTVNIANNELDSSSVTLATLPEGEVYLPFTDERYSLIRSSGQTETLTADKFTFSSNGREIRIRNLGPNNTGAQLIVTVSKSNVKSKTKVLDRVRSLIVDKSINPSSGIGTTTLNDGLSYGNFAFGTRVQDKLISLNTPDIIEIHGIYETAVASTSDADFGSPEISLTQMNGPTTTTGDMVVGELMVGQTSGATAVFVEVKNTSTLRYIPKNNFKFVEGEEVLFQESQIRGLISVLNSSAFDISSNYTFGTGQKGTFYNYGFLTRKSDSEAPDKKIKIYFKSASFDSSDVGDIVTAESYNNFDYSTEIKFINGIINTDLIDLRPRVSEYTVSDSIRSPLEFLGRTFTSSGNTVQNILASNENIFLDFSYYQGRIDRLYLHKDGKFQMKFGNPSDDPVRSQPESVDNAIEIAEIQYPPYLHNIQQASIKFLKYKRFQMRDIKRLEDRIKSLEYYTQLSMLETNTANAFIPDSNGINRFKSGFFVDNFTSFLTQDYGRSRKNSIDQVAKTLRPTHYTTSVDLQTGPVVDVDPTEDKRSSQVEGINIRKRSDTVCLDYSEVEYTKQVFATRTESVTPFLISFWQGTVTLVPASDNWVAQTRLDTKSIETIGNYAQVMAQAEAEHGVDPQTGFAATQWNSWETEWTGVTSSESSTRRRTEILEDRIFARGRGRQAIIRRTTSQTVEDSVVNTIETGINSRTGTRVEVIEEFNEINLGDKVLSTDTVKHVRSRNVEFFANNLKPVTRIYAFLDGKDVSNFCVPKLIEITMSSGVFEVGETVEGRVISRGLSEVGKDTNAKIQFRVAQSNHRKGDYDVPSDTYSSNPYSDGLDIPASYSSTSTTLNVDTFSLSNQPQGDFFGHIQTGMKLVGKTSGAEAEVSNVRLVSDAAAILVGSLFIPDPDNLDNPQFETGTNVFTLSNDPDNDTNIATTIAEEAYPTAGTLETVQEQILSIRNARIENRQTFEEDIINRTINTEVVSSRNIGQATDTDAIIGWRDPLAQSFQVAEDPGIFITKCDVFFRTKDDGEKPVRLQIRSMNNGFPTQHVIPFSEVVLLPNQIDTSTDGSVATTFEFEAPVYLQGGNTEYAICLLSNSTKYSVYISRVGEVDILEDTFISNQPTLGSLFKSQNASTWEASQWEDLKFTLYRADFVDSGTLDLYSPELSEGNRQIPTLMPNPLSVSSKQIRVGLSSIIAGSSYEIGNTFFQDTTNATGSLVGVAASAVGSLAITNAGIGYTPASGSLAYTGVNLITISGNGSGATADLTVSNGVITAAAIANASGTATGGNGYQVGDVLSINAIGVSSVGRNARFTLTSIGHTTQLLLDNVQGDFITGAAGTMRYVDSSGTARLINHGTGGNVTILASGITEVSDGLHIKVNHKNHGMNFEDNFVTISNILPDSKPTKLTAAYDRSSTDPIQVEDASTFSSFENIGVGATNTGLIIIGEEIIEYTNSTATTLGGSISRGVNNTTIKSYPIDTPVFKYELGGINLARVNKTHDLEDVTVANPITLDSYNIKLDMSKKYGTIGSSDNPDRSVDSPYPKLFIASSKTTGGDNVKATQNLPFEIIKPVIHNLTVEGTTVSAQVRTVSSQSISGTEIPYANKGFEDVTLNTNNYFDSPRAIYSRVNEIAKLDSIEGNKSLQMRIFLGTTNSHVSPCIDLQRSNLITISNRVNSVVSNFATDPRVKTIVDDPTACQYITKEMTIANPASAIRLLFDAHVNSVTDIRAFYTVSAEPGIEPIFTPFPGFLNINSRGEVINESNNDGRPNVFVEPTVSEEYGDESNEYKEYSFEVDNLPSFRSYRIKLLLTSTDQTLVPKIRSLRAIALA